jgi:hypothetical protein
MEQSHHGLEVPQGATNATQAEQGEIGQNPSQKEEEYETAQVALPAPAAPPAAGSVKPNKYGVSKEDEAIGRAIERAFNNAYENANGLISSMTGEEDEAENEPKSENKTQDKDKTTAEEPIEDLEENALRPPPGSKPIDKTPWSGNHQEIKKDIDARPGDRVSISPEGNVWGENVDGTWTNHGPAKNYTGSGEPRGRRGKDRGGRGRHGR